MSAEIRKKLAVNYGLLLGAAGVVISVIQYVTVEDFNMAVRDSGNGALAIAGIVLTLLFPLLALLKAKKEQGGFITFGEGFKLAFSVVIYSALINVVWILLYTLVLEPGYQEAAQEAAIEQMYEQNPDMSDDQMDQAISMMGNFTTPWMMALFGILFSAIMGAIIAVIEAAIIQKKPSEFS